MKLSSSWTRAFLIAFAQKINRPDGKIKNLEKK